MEVLNRIGVGSAARFSTAGGVVLGLIAGVIYSFGGAIIDTLVSAGWITSDETPGLSSGTALAFGALLGMPVIGGVAGLVTGVSGAWLYNSVASRVGGVKVDLQR